MVVNRIDTVQMAADSAAIDRSRADVVRVVVHWGEEYQRRPNRSQRAVADFCRRQGVELIIGSHPHVAQPIECDSAARWATVYSLGNMVSNRQWRYSDGGLMVEVALSRVGDAVASMSVRAVPIWVLCPDYRIIPPSVGDTLTMNAVARSRYKQFMNDCQILLK
jgi:poly-gamma-glutamate synthesis protein (capsule biosynthesis protein)